VCSAQPPIELLRQVMGAHGFYDRKKHFFREVTDTLFITACAPPGGGRNPVTPRLLRHFNMVNIPNLSATSMQTIFQSILCGFLDSAKFTQEFLDMAPRIVAARSALRGPLHAGFFLTRTAL
jgi:dynein heavy chain